LATSYPELLHPNLREIILRPLDAKEVALMDAHVGVIIQQWQLLLSLNVSEKQVAF
jgi:hypothetical protein